MKLAPSIAQIGEQWYIPEEYDNPKKPNLKYSHLGKFLV
jgi:hypothetical protein